MDWLSNLKAHIDCLKREIILIGSKRERMVHSRKHSKGGVRLIMSMKVQKLLKGDCEGFLCAVLETKAPESFLKDIPVVQEFTDVFPKEIPCMPPPREVKFCINHVYGATPTSKVPYRMAPGNAQEAEDPTREVVERIHKTKYVLMRGSRTLCKEEG